MARQLPAYLMLASGMAVFGSGTPVSKIVTGAFPIGFASASRMALGAMGLALWLGLVALARRRGAVSWESHPDQSWIGSAPALADAESQ